MQNDYNKFRRIFVRSFLLLVLLNNCNSNYLCAESVLCANLASHYQYLEAKDLMTIKQPLDELLSLNKLADISDDNLFECVCLLERIKVIDWSPEQKKDISDFLLNLASEMSKRLDFLKGADSLPTKQVKRYGQMIPMGVKSPADIFLSALEKHGFFSETLHKDELNTIWGIFNADNSDFADIVRESLIRTVGGQIRFPESVDLLKEWKASSRQILKMEQVDFIDNHLIPMHEIALQTDESNAWEIFWEKVRPSPIENVVTLPYLRKLNQKLKDFKFARKKIDTAVVSKIIDNTDDFFKKYVFVQIAISHVNKNGEATHLDYVNTEPTYLELKTIVDSMTLVINKNIKLKKLDGFLDYNHNHIESFLKLIREMKEYNAKQKIEEENIRKQYDFSSSAKVNTNSQHISFIRPEEQGDDFSKLDTAALLKIITSSPDKIEHWKAGKVLGDRCIDRTFVPTPAEQTMIDGYVAHLFNKLFKSDNPGDAGDASFQLQRLWGLAVPGLLQGLKSKDRQTWNNALEHLVRMRSEQVVKSLIAEYEQTTDNEYKDILINTLGKMRTMYDNQLDYRKMMNSKQSQDLAEKLIVPFLNKIAVTETDEQLQNSINQAKKHIATPIDSRSMMVDPKTGKQIPIEEEVEEATETSKTSNDSLPIDKPTVPQLTPQPDIELDSNSKSSDANWSVPIVATLLILVAIYFIIRKSKKE